MAHRDTNTEKWDDGWFQELPYQSKLLWLYICDKCDQAGVWKENQKLAQFQIGVKIDFDKSLLDFNGRVDKICDRWVIKSFIKFHYGRLSENHKMYKKVCSCLDSHKMGYSIDTLSIVYLENGNTLSTTSDSLKDKDKDNDKDNDKDKEAVVEKIKLPWNTEAFAAMWERWKKFKKEQHRFTYKSQDTEQTALNKLKADYQTELRAAAAIEYSISQGYKWIFEDKNRQVKQPTQEWNGVYGELVT